MRHYKQPVQEGWFSVFNNKNHEIHHYSGFKSMTDVLLCHHLTVILKIASFSNPKYSRLPTWDDKKLAAKRDELAAQIVNGNVLGDCTCYSPGETIKYTF